MDGQEVTSAVRLAEQLIARASVTPDDAGCQALLAERLTAAGFRCVHLPAGPAEATVSNLWAIHTGGRPGPVIGLAGHTDVVPPGPAAAWTTPPFVPSHRDGHLHGRGAADMKTAVAAMVVAAERFVQADPQHAGAVAFLLTSDEEGPARDGTVRIVEWLQAQGQRLDACIVGEATSVERLGDMIKNGRRGTMSGKLTVKGIQGHIAYPQLARNPIHQVAPALAELVATEWDAGNAFFPPTTWQVSNIHGGTGASNVIPGTVVVDFNFRFSTESTPEGLQQRLQAVLERHGLTFDLQWTLGGLPFLTRPGTLVAAVQAAIRVETGIETQLSTTGGTSDGRFIARICPEVIELGPTNATIHKIDENVPLSDIEPLTAIYRRVLENLDTELRT